MTRLGKIICSSIFCLALVSPGALQAQTEQLSPAQATQRSSTVTPSLPVYTPQERLKDYLRRTFGVQAFLFSGMSAGVGQARNAPSEWGQGAEGFGKRFASSMAQRTVANTIQLPVEWSLGEDSRYAPSGRSGLGPRVGYAVRHSLLIRDAHHLRTIPIGVLIGCYAGGLLSRKWQPNGHDQISQGLVSGTISFGFYVSTNVFQEFWPDARKLLHF